MPDSPRRNIELKARLHDLQRAQQTAAQLCGEPEVQLQVDTYYVCAHGRLKLREINSRSAELIWYARADRDETKRSDYRILPINDAAQCHALLAAALGVRVVVHKHREIYLHNHVRIHLDRVDGLGDFLEFEAVLAPNDAEAPEHQRLRELAETFGICWHDLISGSYADLS